MVERAFVSFTHAWIRCFSRDGGITDRFLSEYLRKKGSPSPIVDLAKRCVFEGNRESPASLDMTRISLSKLQGVGITGNVDDFFCVSYDHRGFTPISWKRVEPGTVGAVPFWELLKIISDTL